MFTIQDLIDQFEIQGDVQVRIYDNTKEKYIVNQAYSEPIYIPNKYRNLEIQYMYADKNSIVFEVGKKD